MVYDSSKRDELEDVVRIRALRAAKNKAIALAEAIGSEIAEPIVIQEAPHFEMRIGAELDPFSDDVGGGDASPVQPGTVSIRSSIRAAFRLVTIEK